MTDNLVSVYEKLGEGHYLEGLAKLLQIRTCPVAAESFQLAGEQCIPQYAKQQGIAEEHLTERDFQVILQGLMQHGLTIELSDQCTFAIQDGMCIPVVPDTATSEEAVNTFWSTWDILVPQKEMHSVALRPLVDRAVQEGEKHKYPVHKMTSKGLLDFVTGYLERSILTLEDVPDMASMVFMPFGMGMFNLPKEVEDPFKDLAPGTAPDAPKEPELPIMPPEPVAPNEPQPPKLAKIPAEKLEEIKKLSWEDQDEADKLFAEAKAKVDKKNKPAQDEFDRKHAEWLNDPTHQQNMKEWNEQCQELQAKYDKELEAFNTFTETLLKEQTVAWQIKAGIEKIVTNVFEVIRLQDVGTVWASDKLHDKAPRSINGMPMYFSCAIMSKSDLKRVSKMVQEEFKRREDLRREMALEMGEDPDAVPPEKAKTVDDLVMEAEPVITQNADGTRTLEKKWINPDGTEGCISATLTGDGPIGPVYHLK